MITSHIDTEYYVEQMVVCEYCGEEMEITDLNCVKMDDGVIACKDCAEEIN